MTGLYLYTLHKMNVKRKNTVKNKDEFSLKIKKLVIS